MASASSGGPSQAPELRTGRAGGGGGPPPPPKLAGRVKKTLARLDLAIAELTAIAGFSGVGALVEQQQPVAYYLDKFGGDGKLLGVLDGEAILFLRLDHIFVTPLFLGLMALLAASLAVCSQTRQWPMFKVAQRWRFMEGTRAWEAMPARSKVHLHERVESTRVEDVCALLVARGYEVFRRGDSVYGFKGLVGKLGPIGVHVALVAVLAGGALGLLYGWEDVQLVPEGAVFGVDRVIRQGPLARVPPREELSLQLNAFTIEYLPAGQVGQFYSDLSAFAPDPEASSAEETVLVESARKRIRVNDPLRVAGTTWYQTDWGMAALEVELDGGDPVALRMAQVDEALGAGGRLWGTVIPADVTQAESATEGTPILGTAVARDFNQVALYDAKGDFVGVRRPESGNPIDISGHRVVVRRVVGASGFQAKSDPGVPLVYVGFAGLMATVAASGVSHGQVWACVVDREEGEEGDGPDGGAMREKPRGGGQTVLLAGRSSRSQIEFDYEMRQLIEQLPTYN